jgi:hypothetical protein
MFSPAGVLASSDNNNFTFTSGPTLIIQIIIGLAVLAFSIYVALDINKRSDGAFKAAGTTKGLWMGLSIGGGVLGLCCCPLLGIIVPIIWLASYRNKVDAAGGGPAFGGPAGGPPPSGDFGGPPPGGGFGGPPPGGGFPPPPAG